MVEIQKIIEELKTDQKSMAEDVAKLKMHITANDKEFIDVINS